MILRVSYDDAQLRQTMAMLLLNTNENLKSKRSIQHHCFGVVNMVSFRSSEGSSFRNRKQSVLWTILAIGLEYKYFIKVEYKFYDNDISY